MRRQSPKYRSPSRRPNCRSGCSISPSSSDVARSLPSAASLAVAASIQKTSRVAHRSARVSTASPRAHPRQRTVRLAGGIYLKNMTLLNPDSSRSCYGPGPLGPRSVSRTNPGSRHYFPHSGPRDHRSRKISSCVGMLFRNASSFPGIHPPSLGPVSSLLTVIQVL
jgi:hypothetical protein